MKLDDYFKYMTEAIDSKSKRMILKYIDHPPKNETLLVNDKEVKIMGNRWVFPIDLPELAMFLVDTVDAISDKEFTSKTKKNTMEFIIK